MLHCNCLWKRQRLAGDLALWIKIYNKKRRKEGGKEHSYVPDQNRKKRA